MRGQPDPKEITGICDPSKTEEKNLRFSSIVSGRDFKPYVQIEFGDVRGQMTTCEAREIALQLLEVAEVSETDAFMVQYLQERVGLKPGPEITQVLADLRVYREQIAVKHRTYDRTFEDLLGQGRH